MPPIAGLYNTVDVTEPDDASIGSGFGRPPEQIRSHRFEDALDGEPRHIDASLQLGIEVTNVAGVLDVAATVTNISEGHAVPSGEPMRALLLVVDATCGGQQLDAVGGLSIDTGGGEYARGLIDADVTAAGPTLTWAAGAAVATPGQVLRAIRPTGTFHDYPGVGRFAGGQIPANEKGLPILDPVFVANVIAVGTGTLTLDDSPQLMPGDIVILGDAWPENVNDADPARMLAGAPGVMFAKLLVDASGTRHVPHHRAIDVVRDNRLMPGAPNISNHRFALDGCVGAQARARLLYRRVPIEVARERSWDARDHLIGLATAALTP